MLPCTSVPSFSFFCIIARLRTAAGGKTHRETFMRVIVFISFFFCLIAGRGQRARDSSHCDCSKALSIPVYKKHHHSAPSGFGQLMEFEHNGMKNGKYFDKEHNTIWYSFSIPNDGMLAFDIIPDTVKDDYDFILFKQGGRGTCDSIRDKTLAPVRANISHNAASTRGLTGLSSSGHHDFNKPGVHEHYSRPLQVRTGERYLLVLDNVYENGRGHTLRFYFNFKLQGLVVDSLTNKPLTAQLSLQDIRKNVLLKQASSDSMNNGRFEIPIVLDDSLRWNLTVSAPGYFSESIVLTENSISALLQRPRTFKLRKIEKNKSFALKDINFLPNKAVFRNTSQPALQSLLNVMRDNATLKILIEGHTNFDPSISPEIDLKLSEDRALAVKRFLSENAIDPERMSTKGYGSTRMIFPNPRSADQQQANMRVEIKIVDF
jgi:outer membrane protein OmpA-like peptidoglycan-associated protein